MISAAIKPFIYRQVIRSCSTNSVSSCCKDIKWLCTFGFSETGAKLRFIWCVLNQIVKNSKKKKRSDFLQNFGGNSPTDGTRQTGFTVAALNKKTFYTADHFYEKVQRKAPVRNSFWKRSVKQTTVDWEVFQFHSFKEKSTC